MKTGLPHHCFENAGRAILQETDSHLRYVEGFHSLHGHRAHHSWLENIETGERFEVTLPTLCGLYEPIIRLDKARYAEKINANVSCFPYRPVLKCSAIGCIPKLVCRFGN